jgi:transmembrane sensor
MNIKKHSVKKLQRLAQKVMEGKASEAEKLFLNQYYDFFENPKNETGYFSDAETEGLYRDIKNKLSLTTNPAKVKKLNHFTLTRVAAAIALLMISSVFVYKAVNHYGFKNKLAISNAKANNKPIVHGGNKATLTLANGAVIVLDDKVAGTLAKQAGVKISKTADGQIVYTAVQNPGDAALNKFNTMQTPRGGLYQVTLPDGTKVWLNSASTLKYPLAFSGGERKVELNGEAYFEVAHNKDLPFRVISPNQTVEVLGTHFNVNTYTDEAHSKTTLLEGSVRITALNFGVSKVLSPGEQAIIKSSGIQVKIVDTDNAIAWKNGLFQFDNEDIHTIMRKISRWYDVDVEYKEDLGDMRFGGSVSRFTDIQQVLRKLELTNTIHFKIEGRRIIVMK